MNENMILNLGGSGGGAALNFKVVGNPQPETAKENTIWVNTDVPIGAWYFDATQPENLNEGDVWFPTGTSSPVAFNVLKKNGIQVYPLSAKQFVGGTLVEKNAQIYQGGAWIKWWDGELFDNGNQHEFITGGWVTGSYASVGGTVSVGDTLKLSAKGTEATASVRTKNKIDLSEWSSIQLNANIEIGDSNALFVTEATSGSSYAASKWYSTTSNGKTVELDVSALSGEYYVCVSSKNGSIQDVTEVKLAR